MLPCFFPLDLSSGWDMFNEEITASSSLSLLELSKKMKNHNRKKTKHSSLKWPITSVKYSYSHKAKFLVHANPVTVPLEVAIQDHFDMYAYKLPQSCPVSSSSSLLHTIQVDMSKGYKLTNTFKKSFCNKVMWQGFVMQTHYLRHERKETLSEVTDCVWV